MSKEALTAALWGGFAVLALVLGLLNVDAKTAAVVGAIAAVVLGVSLYAVDKRDR